jgi:hypothetical protein
VYDYAGVFLRVPSKQEVLLAQRHARMGVDDDASRARLDAADAAHVALETKTLDLATAALGDLEQDRLRRLAAMGIEADQDYNK